MCPISKIVKNAKSLHTVQYSCFLIPLRINTEEPQMDQHQSMIEYGNQSALFVQSQLENEPQPPSCLSSTYNRF